jgi:multidrug efflux pump subunit AcrA (membrane-fusion protein)
MHYLHGLRIVHRDIKPANIFVDRRRVTDVVLHAGGAGGAGAGADGKTLVLVIGDLGSAKRVHEKLTHATGGAFTPAYVPPEVRITGECTFEADVYAAGCVVVEMLTRACVHDAETVAATAAAALCVERREGADALALVAAKMAAAAAARRACADDAAQAIAVGAAVPDDCWVTRETLARLVEAVTQERLDRCTFAQLFELGKPKREQLQAAAAAAAAAAASLAAAAAEARRVGEEVAAEVQAQVQAQVQALLDEVQHRMSTIEAAGQQAAAEAQHAKAEAQATTVRAK